ncbi:MAG: transcriptional regulator GcvA [Zetaproteobacteria bacterium]|nr:MAG: transcriptional regulator GcvA [Zetaproteobacteria bacterium]
MPDTSRIPSLNALRAFAVAGAHLNLRAAAAELFVTPSALSHQIRNLEQQLDIKLFIRGRQGLTLTATGKVLLPQVSAAFAQLSEAVHSIKSQHHSGTITVSMLSTFAMRWFIPRLYRFQQKHPDIKVRISTSIELVDFEQEDVDCAIRSGQGSWPGTHALRLLDEQFTPVCSPSLPTGDTPLNQPSDLAGHTLLHSRLRPDDWQAWLSAEGLADLQPRQDQEFETRNFAIAAAIRGLGVAIIDPLLVQEELKDRRLIQPFTHALPTTSAYYLVWSATRGESEELAAFRTWLIKETAGSG